MAPRRGAYGEMTGPTEPSPEVIYPIIDYGKSPRAMMEAPVAINSLYLVALLSCAFIFYRYTNRDIRKGLLVQLPLAFIFLSSSTIFNITTGTLFLAEDLSVRQTYNIMRAFFTMSYYLGKLCLLESIFSILHNRLCALSPGRTPRAALLMIYLDRLFVAVMFAVLITIVGFNIKYTMDSNDMYRGRNGVTWENSVGRYQIHWDRVVFVYDLMLLICGLHFSNFSSHLLRRANKLNQDKREIKVLLALISTAIIVNGMFFVLVDLMSFRDIVYPWARINVAQTVIDTVTMICAISGVLWVAMRREDWVPGITGNGTAPHLRDIIRDRRRL
ncbi:hypothetical protein DFP73DRAFT_589847 [Morchella snyderi]|nr:hypothetical protein DFP73DRAFT_589847 [Morchella snyderi]